MFVMMNGNQLPLTEAQAQALVAANLIYADDPSNPDSHTTAPALDDRAYSLYGEPGHEITYLIREAGATLDREEV